jgi:5-methyltetrahydropteroyltriglutamate--homocysteine methyltransferase
MWSILLFAQDRGERIDEAQFDKAVRNAVSESVRRQLEAGIDIIDDGEMSKISYATYIRHRLTGFEGDSARPTPKDLDDFPEYRATGWSKRAIPQPTSGPSAKAPLP